MASSYEFDEQEAATPDDLDQLLTQIGVGKWNFIFYTTALLSSATFPGFVLGSEFYNAIPAFTCDLPNDGYTSYNGSECLMVKEQRVVPCTSWIYDTSVFTSTVAMEWDLVCEREYLASFFQTSVSGGSCVGCILSAVLTHRYGRRWTIRFGAVCITLSMAILMVVPWFSLVLAARFLIGVFDVILIYSSSLLNLEVCAPQVRSAVCLLLVVPAAIMTIGLAGLAYCIRDWRSLQLATAFPCLFLLPVAFLVDESPRWLLIQGRLEEAVKVLGRGFILNGRPPPSGSKLTTILSTMIKNQKSGMGEQLMAEKETQSFSEEDSGEDNLLLGSQKDMLGAEDGFGSWWAAPVALVSNLCMRKRTGVMLYHWFVVGLLYLSIPLSSETFSSPFLYMGLLGMMELPAYTMSVPITKRLGRRSSIVYSMFFSAFLFLSIAAITLTSINEEMVLLLVMVSYFSVSIAFQVNFLYTPELFPTSLRPWGTGICSTFSQIGYAIAPFLTDNLVQDLPWLAFLLHGLLAFLSGALILLLLPETSDCPLPETVADLPPR